MSRRALKLLRRYVPLGLLATASLAASEPPATLGAKLSEAVAQHDVPGLAVIVLHGDRIVAESYAGVKKRGESAKLGPDDRFHIGSNTKAMTATLAARLVEQGKVAWTTSVVEAFASRVDDIDPAWKPITLQHLLAHRAGLPANPGKLTWLLRTIDSDPAAEQRADLVEDLLAEPPALAPGTFRYSNLGYVVAGTWLEQRMAATYEQLLERGLFQPLGIATAGFGPPREVAQSSPVGHSAKGRPVDGDNPSIYNSAGRVHLTLRDYAKFVALHLRAHAANPARQIRLLQSETFAVLHEPVLGGDYTPGGWGVRRRPWAKGQREGDVGAILTHNGSNTMWYCVVCLAPEIDRAVVVACNQGGPAAMKACEAATAAAVELFIK